MERLQKAAIHLVLLMAVTSSVVAENAPKRQTNNLNLPPEAIDFDLSDLIDADQQLRDQKQRDEWTAYQDTMTAAYAETKTFVDSGSDTAAGIEAWQRFLKAFEADNPFAKEDDSMRAQAKNAMLGLEEVERTLQTEWSDYQEKMTKAYQDVLAFLGTKPDLNLRTQSINRFLEAFSADNPFSEEDDAMRGDARGGLTSLESTVTASNGAAEIYSTESQGSFAGIKSVTEVVAQGRLLLEAGQIEEAKIAFLLALHLVHREEGLFGINQLPIINYLTATNLRERNSLAADQQQRFAFFVKADHLDPQDPKILRINSEMADWYMFTGQTQRARRLLEEGIEKATSLGLDPLPLAIELSRARRLEGICCASKKLLELVKRSSNTDPDTLANAYLELADTYILARKEVIATEYFLKANEVSPLSIDVDPRPISAREAFSSPLAQQGKTYLGPREDILDDPSVIPQWFIIDWKGAHLGFTVPDRYSTSSQRREIQELVGNPILFRKDQLYNVMPLRLEKRMEELKIELSFTVTSEGDLEEIEVINSTAPVKLDRLVVDALRKAHYRPGLVNGLPVTTKNVSLVQTFASR